MNQLLQSANIFFFTFHVLLILFNLFGWIFKKLRKWNLLTLSITAFSWFILGIFYGFGYCFLTDWHWQIRDELGYPNPFDSYIQFLITSLLNITVPEDTVDLLTIILFFAAFLISIITNIRDYKNNAGH